MGFGDLPSSQRDIECSCGKGFSGKQREAMGKAVDHLVKDHGLFKVKTPPIQPKQAKTRVLIAEEGVTTHPDGRTIVGEWELSTGNLLNTNHNKPTKERYLDMLADWCGVTFRYNW